MRLVFTGLPGSGKTTVYNALSSRKLTDDNSRKESRIVLLPVPDERFDRLATQFQPKKLNPAKVTFLDPALPVKKSDDPSAKFPAEVKTAEGLVEVIRNFDGGLGVPTPAADMSSFAEEMLLSDMVTAENRLEKLRKEVTKGRTGDPEELKLLEEAYEILSQEKFLITNPELADHPKLRGYCFLTAKTIISVVNNDDEDSSTPENLLREPVIVRARLEAELAELEEDERIEFQEDLGIEVSALDRLIQAGYASLNLITFFTLGPEELRAWAIPKGATALQAARAIHSDIEKGFIRCEIIRWDEILEYGSEAALKKVGKVKVVGKEHVMDDGDVIHILFNI